LRVRPGDGVALAGSGISASRGVVRPFGVSVASRCAAYWLRGSPSRPCGAWPWTSGFWRGAVHRLDHSRRRSSRGIHSPAETSRAVAAASRAGDPVRKAASSLEVSRPYSVSLRGAAACRPGLPPPVTCVFELSRPLDAFIRPAPPGLVSCRIRSWGSFLQSIAPPAQPCARSPGVVPSCRFCCGKPAARGSRAFFRARVCHVAAGV
jgi:hypothetical protein